MLRAGEERRNADGLTKNMKEVSKEGSKEDCTNDGEMWGKIYC
jgi:hypothetical protein